MKRSRSIRLVLIGSVAAGTLAGCGPQSANLPIITTGSVYTNNHHVPGVGYYHAPFRAWYPFPYNFFNPQSRQYTFGGQLGAAPHQSITNISEPTAAAAEQAEAQRTDVPRGGFGRTSHRHSSWS